MAGCVFCAIVAGEAPASVLYEDDRVMVFLDIAPMVPGHCLVIPKAHHDCLDDLPAELAGALLAMGTHVSRAIQAGLGAHGTLAAMNTRVGQTVHHAHLHIVPRRRWDGVVPFKLLWPFRRYRSEAHRDAVQRRLVEALAVDLGDPQRAV